MRFPLRRNANVLDTLLTETLQILVVFSIMGWPFSGMQQCETKGMNAERTQQQHNKQQQFELQLQQQQQYPQKTEQFHKVAKQTIAMIPVVSVAGPASGLSSFRHSEMVAARATRQASTLSSTTSTSMSSSLGTHDMHSALSIITKDYQHKSAPTSSTASSGNGAFTQPIATNTVITTKKATATQTATATGTAATATADAADLSNENVNGVSALPVGFRLLTSRASSPLAALHALHRVTKDTQHSSIYAELPSVSGDNTNESLEIDNMDYVMSKHIASLTHSTADDVRGVSVSVSASASATPTAYAYAISNNSSNSNLNININDYNSSSNNQTRNDLMSLSLQSMSDENMELSSTMIKEMAFDTSLTTSNKALATLSASSSSSSSSLSSSATSSATAERGPQLAVVAESASLISADLADTFGGSVTSTSKSNRKSAYDRSALGADIANGLHNQTANMQHLGSQRIAMKTTAKTKTTIATEQQQQQQHSAQHNAKSQAMSIAFSTATTGAGATTGRQQRGSAKKVESKYVLPKPQKTDAPMLNYIFDTFSSANKHHHHDQRYGPHFEDVQRVGQPTNMTVQAGSSIHLNCRISLLQDKTVSWVRRNAQGENALDLLTVGLHTYTGDKRYKMEFQYPNNWRLKIANVKKDDEAMYECQISTHPPRVIQINLFVNAPKVMIVDEFGDPLQEKYYEIDSTLQLSCIVRNVAMATSVVFWKHGDDVLNYDVTRGGISVKTELMDDGANSTLSIAKINKSDSGNYTCAISDFQNFSIVVHILNGESFAELHHGAAASRVPNAFHHQLLVIESALISSLLLLLLLLNAPQQPYIHVHR